MSYKVDFENIGILNCDEILKSIDVVTTRHHCDFMIVGATARDLNFELVYDYNEEYRATRDIDIGIAISDWDKFDLIVRDLVELGFEKSSGRDVHRLNYKGIPIDLVPFGGIEEDGIIKWPPDFSFEMSVAGFKEVFDAALEFEMSDGVTFKVVSLAGLVILKIIAWQDRKYTTQKDGEDIIFLLINYVEIDPDSLFDEHSDLIDRPDYDYLKAGAQVLARKIKNILFDSPVIQGKIDKIIGSETVDIETSELARIPGYNSNVVENFALLKAFRDELII